VAVGLANSQTGVDYQLKIGGANTGSPVPGTTGSPISFGLQTAAGTYTVEATDGTTNCVATMTGNAVVSITADLSLVSITPAAQTICIGGSGSLLTATETGGGTITARQWVKRSTPGGPTTNLSATGSTYTPTGAELGAGISYVVCISTPTCGASLYSNEVTVTVNANLSTVTLAP
jgi:hypothetical protein